MRSRISGEGSAVTVHSVDQGWEFFRGSLSSSALWSGADTRGWSAVQIPHCFNAEDACDPDVPYYRGQGWYRTRLKIANPFTNGRTLLHFDGAGQTSHLWIGTELIGTHKGGYDEFAFDITDAIERVGTGKEIPIAVCCDNSPDHDRVPSDLSDFCLYGGLYRRIRLVYLPAVGLERIHVRSQKSPEGTWHVSVNARMFNPSHISTLCKISVVITDAAGEEVGRTETESANWEHTSEIASLALSQPKLWSPEAPHLYQCTVLLSNELGETELVERFGLRYYEFVENGPFLLNGKRVLLRGTQRHADHAGVAAAMSDELVQREMKLIREMGANFIRLAHYQQDRLVLDLCDELGIMVWEEAPWCRAGVGNSAFQRNAKQMLAHMIEQHFNHPSVILWGLGNEDDWPEEYPSVDEKAIRAFMTEMRDLAHHLDPTRLTAFRRCEFARDIPDVYSPSIWAGWYRGQYREYEKSLLQERKKVKRFIHMEWGADSLRGRHSEDPEAALHHVATNRGTDERGLAYLKSGGDARVSKDGDWSETYACNLFDWYLKTQDKLDWLTGSAQWIFKDFASPLRTDSSIPRINMKGVVERDLTPKESYFVFQSYWAEKPMVRIYGHTWPVRWGVLGQKRTVRVYSNCEQAELFLNGASLGIRKRDSQDFPAAGLRWEVPFVDGSNHLRVAARKGSVEVSDEVTVRYETARWDTPSTLRLSAIPREDSLIALHAELVDAKGNICLDAAHQIRFSLAGHGRLIDNLGTSRGSRVVQLSNGRAEISAICNGTCRLTATAEGIPAAHLNVS